MSLTTLEIKAFNTDIGTPGIQYSFINFQAVDYYMQPTIQEIMQYGPIEDLTTTPFLTFVTPADAIAYYLAADCAALVTQINTSIGSSFYTDYDVELVDTPVQTIFNELATVAFSGQSSDLDNDAGFVTAAAQAAAISSAVAGLVNSAPGTLDTLKELADAINDDASYAATITTALGNKVDKVVGKGLSTNDYTTAEQTKLAGLTSPKAYEGITLRANAFPIFAHATVASGIAVFYLTADGTSTGTALFPNGIIQDSINLFVSDATASYQMGAALTNSNKTLTVTTNKLTTANILTGLLGQAAANGAVVKLQVWGY